MNDFSSIIILLMITIATPLSGQQINDPVEAQLVAYNNRDIEAFLKPYSDTVKVYNFPDELSYKGKNKMKEIYGKMFERTLDLHCNLVNRIRIGKTVIDHEEVTFEKGKPILNAVAIYTIAGDKIIEVRFIRG